MSPLGDPLGGNTSGAMLSREEGEGMLGEPSPGRGAGRLGEVASAEETEECDVELRGGEREREGVRGGSS